MSEDDKLSDDGYVDNESESRFGDVCPECGDFNSPPSGETCRHLCAFVWDGSVEAMGCGVQLQAAFERLRDLVEASGADAALAERIEKLSADKADLAALVEGARNWVSFAELLASLDGFSEGNGWTTNGMLGGAGYNIYVESSERVTALLAICHLAQDGA